MSAFESDQLPLFSCALYSPAVSLYTRPEKEEVLIETQFKEPATLLGSIAVSPEDLLTA